MRGLALARGARFGLAGGMTSFAIAFALAALCQAPEGGVAAAAEGAPGATLRCPGLRAADDWRNAAREDDRRRLRQWRDDWVEALEAARGAGHGGEIAEGGPLFEPDAALAGPAPPPGDYLCRTVKLGAASEPLLDYVAYPPFRCRIGDEGGRMTLVKLTGSQRPVGRLYADTERRMVFLGAMQLGDEGRAYQYGADADRDVAGVVERVGERRWRLVIPYPRFESLLDVIELTPIDEE